MCFPEACEFLFVDILPRQFVVGFSRQDGQQMVAVIGGLDSWDSPMNPWLLWKGYSTPWIQNHRDSNHQFTIRTIGMANQPAPQRTPLRNKDLIRHY